MKNSFVFAAVASSGLAALALLACSSSSTTPSYGDGGAGGGDSGAPVGTDSGGASDSGASFGSWGLPCTNPINTGGGSGGGDGGGGGGADGGADPACVGTYDVCATIGKMVQCTKACTYTGTSGPQADPTDCPSPPTNGMCTPRGFCQ